MSGPTALRTALLAGGAFAATLLAVSLAGAEDVPLAESAPLVDFSDPVAAIRDGEGTVLDLSVRDVASRRFAPPDHAADAESSRRFEVEIAAGGGDAPFDVSIAQRATLGADANGDVARHGSGSELRIGRGLVERRDDDEPSSVYMFVASDDEALTWRPGVRSEFGGQGASLALQDRVEVGDLSAGVTYERNGVQASLAYVEREESTRVGQQSFSQDESFTGVTVTMRR